MQNQVFFEDVVVGNEVPNLVKRVTTRQLVKWAGVSGDFTEIHYDKDAAIAGGLSGVIVHGWLAFSAHGQMLQDWIGIDGDLKSIKCSYRGMLYPNKNVTYRGKVANKQVKDGENLVECEIWCEDHEGKVANRGSAVVALPSRTKTK